MEIGRRRRDVSMIETSNLRDLLKRRDSDEGLESLAGLTLAAVLGCDEAQRAPTRTLMDIINDEESGAAYRGLALPNEQRHNNKQQSWKSFKDRLRIRRAGVAWSASSADPLSPTEFNLEDVRLEISPPISSSGPSNRNTVPISTINGGGDSVQANNPAGGGGSSENSQAYSVATSAPNPASPMAAAAAAATNSGGDSVLASNPVRISEEITQIMAESSNIPAPTANVGDLNPAPAPIQARNEENSSIQVENSASDVSPSTQGIRLAAALEAEREEQRMSRQRQEAEEIGTEPAMPPPPPPPPRPPMRMSLMDLLGETETGTRFMGGEEEEEEEEGCEEEKLGCKKEEEEEGKEEGKVEFVCCVCMVRHKDAAFIPCGHTFCRVCSKELWVSRGNCPLCNNFILEILHIF